ncbi:MAG: DUF4838 domain-containing protein [Spirochaetaceae bacterium]
MNYDIKIIVNLGAFKSFNEALQSEQNINWWDEKNINNEICSECFAAVELRKHLCLLFNLNQNDKTIFPITDRESVEEDGIYLGSKYYTDSKNNSSESFTVRSITANGYKKLYLSGKGRSGTLYAVYSYLEKLGFSWYGIGDNNRALSKTEYSFMEPCDYRESPSFITRGCYSEFIDDTNEQFVDWLSRNRVNFVALDSVTNPYNLKKRGIKICMGGHHLLYEYLNPSIYGKQHPNWFGLIDGKRSFEIGDGGQEGFGHNYCTSNLEASDQLCRNLVKSLIDGNLKHTDYLNFWLLDNGRWCECDECRNLGNYSFRLSKLVYLLDKSIKEAQNRGVINRDIKILYPAYHETLEAPNNPLPDDFDYETCIVTYFPIERCYVHKINDKKCTETNQELMETYDQWTLNENRNYRGSVLVGEYYNVSSFASSHIPLMQIMKHDIPFYYQSGSRHMHYMHMSDRNWGGMRLTNYQFQKMLWNVDTDVDKLLEDYYNNFYVEVSQNMRQFYELLEKAMCNAKAFKHYQYNNGIRHQLSWILRDESKDVFPLKHLQYDTKIDDDNGGISVVEMISLLKECRVILDRALMGSRNSIVVERLLEDDARFTYTEDIIHFTYYLIQVNLQRKAKNESLAANSFKHAKRYAIQLENNTQMVKKTRRFDLFDNGLLASWCEPVYRKYQSIYDSTRDSRC